MVSMTVGDDAMGDGDVRRAMNGRATVPGSRAPYLAGPAERKKERKERKGKERKDPVMDDAHTHTHT